MKRRAMLQGLLASAGVAAFGPRPASAAPHTGKLFVFVQADGGWDPTSFCDPKMNTPGEPDINHWANSNEIRQAGGIAFAPFAHNAAFFEKYHDRMLVINGVDAQTNSHTVGVVHNWSGRNAEGYPTTTALLAAHFADGQPIGYLNFGGFAAGAGLYRPTRIDEPELLRNVAAPEKTDVPEEVYFDEEEWAILESYRDRSARQLEASPNLLPGEVRQRSIYRAAMSGTAKLQAYANAIPPEDEVEPSEYFESPNDNTLWSTLRRQAQLTVLAFKTGVAVSADLWLGGFDTHDTHDANQGWLLGNLTDAVDYLWQYAELHGVADRLVVLMGSEFGRTNFYNSQDGKDHWPIGSYVIMEKGQRWTNRVVGETDGLHFAQKINPRTLKRDDANGTIIYPKHVHKALRRYLGIENSRGALRFPFNNTEDFGIFG